MGKGWFAVFLATFALSAGAATATYLIATGTATTPQGIVGLVVVCVIPTSVIATCLGMTSLPVQDAANMFSGPWYFASPAGLLVVSAQVYGPVGVILGLGVGSWVGYVGYRRFRES